MNVKQGLSVSILSEMERVYGRKLFEKVKMTLMSESKFFKILCSINPMLKNVGGVTIFNTIYLNDSFNKWAEVSKKGLIMHEMKHAQQFSRFNILHTLTYLIGSPWLLIGLGISLLLNLMATPIWIILPIFAVFLALSSTGIIFPHMRAYWEYEAYKVGNYYEFQDVTPDILDKLKNYYCARYRRIFSGLLYLGMGGFLSNRIALSLWERIWTQVSSNNSNNSSNTGPKG